jgi:hypothetical protein
MASFTYLIMTLFLLSLFPARIFSLPQPDSTSIKCPKPSSPDVHILYIAHQTLGILTFQFNASQPYDKSLSILEANLDGGYRPGWLTRRGNVIFSVSRSQYPTANDTSGGIFAFKLDGQSSNYSIELLSSSSSKGLGSVACSVSKDGRTIAAANMYVHSFPSPHQGRSST